ncbi:MAG: hypothetical protein ACRD68_01150, partial [Pyrinomonadaceae bacterium]
MFRRFQERSRELERMDTGDYTPAEYEHCLADLRVVNRFLGDAGALRRSLLADVERRGGENFSVLDVGAGSGELLRVIVKWARAKRKRARLVGLELNRRSAEAILDESGPFGEIASVRGNA